METDPHNELRSHAWAYFDRHAEQRLKTFNFYLILSTAILAGAFALSKEGGGALYAGSVLALLLSAVSFIFWKLDIRNGDLLRHAEEALKSFEDELALRDEAPGVPDRRKLFRREEADLRLKRPPGSPWWTYWTYRTCFNVLFALFGFGGAVLAIVLASIATCAK